MARSRDKSSDSRIVCGLPVLAMALVAPTFPANAQFDAQSDEAFEEIVVTGSRLKRRDFNAPSPISTIDSETLAYSGQTTLEETLNQMPQVMPAMGRTSNNPGTGTSTVDLRGLGSQRTLVLLNGRRLAPSGAGSSVDLNTLPQALMERVEIITGGAATVYGSDAIAGVVNFVTRDDYDGFGLEASAYTTEKGDSNIYDLNLSYGHEFANGRGNLAAFVSFYDREETFAGDRKIADTAYFETWEGEIVPGGSSRTPPGVVVFPQVDFGNGPTRTTFDPNGVPREYIFENDFYNYAPVTYLQIPMTRYSGGIFFNYDLAGSLETYVEFTHTRNLIKQNLAPVPADLFLTVNLDNPVLTPEAMQLFMDNFIPSGPNLVDFAFRKRLTDLGPRIFDSTKDYTRFVAGLRGDIGSEWDFDIWATYTQSDEEVLVLNIASRSRFLQGMLVDPVTGQCYVPSDGCVPLDVFGEGRLSAEGTEFIRLPNLVNTGTRTQKLASAVVAGPLFDTWAGSVESAFGVEWRDDTGSFESDEALFTGDALGLFAQSGINGTESVYEVYGEALFPLTQDMTMADFLAIEIGARYSNYKNAGEVNTYKYGGEWQPVEGVRFRTMVQKSVRAPNLAEAFEEQTRDSFSYVGPNTSQDPCSASADPIGAGNVEKCVLQGIPENQLGIYEATSSFPATYIYGGNPDLIPESADTFTLGVVLNLDFIPKWQISVDYFDLEVTDTIGDLDATLVCFDANNSENLFCNNIRRDPISYNVIELFEPVVNRGSLKTTGIDTQVHYQSELPGFLSIGNAGADINLNVIWTHLTQNSFQENAVAESYECAGKFGFPCNWFKDGTTYPDDRVTTNINYLAGDLNIHLTWRWIGGSDNAVPIWTDIIGAPDPDLVVADIGSENYIDLGFGYQFTDNIHARFNVLNLLDSDPPFVADAAWQNNVDTGMYDIFGRSYFLGVSLQY